MFDLWKLRLERRRLRRSFASRIRKTRKGHERLHIIEISDAEGERLGDLNAMISHIVGWEIADKAQKLDLELPPNNKELAYWESDEHTNLYFPSSKGRAYLRKIIDEEKSRRFEVKVRWVKLLVPLVTALAALAGAITGIVLALKK